MDDITQIVGNNLQTIRKERQLTLQDLADITGVSKSMLGEIERGVTNPTITVLWKIITGLKIPLTQLIDDNKTVAYTLVKSNEWKSLIPPDKNYEISIIFSYDKTKKFEVYHMHLSPSASHMTNRHQSGIIEYLFIYEGSFVLEVNENKFILEKGDSFIFEGETVHRYTNPGSVEAKAYSIIYYPNGVL